MESQRNDNMYPLTSFITRLKKIGIKIELAGNYPWLYLTKVNDQYVTEKHYSEHYYTIGFYPRTQEDQFKFSDTEDLFKTIRKYSAKP